MRSPISKSWKGPRIVLVQCLVSAGLVLACASNTPQHSVTSSSPSPASQTASECSFFGRLACNTMAIGSRGGTSTCTRVRRGNTYVETCGTTSAPAPRQKPQPQAAAISKDITGSSVQLTWQDNSDNETGFVIERCDEIFREMRTGHTAVTCRGPWKTVGTVSANITTYVDDSVTPNQTYIYRVKATNQFGSSSATPEAVITAPVR